MTAVSAESQFYEYANQLAGSASSVHHRWSEDRLTISFRKINDEGFDIEVSYDPISKELEIQTDRGCHDHFHAEKFESFPAALACVFGLVRDLLSRNMRIEETQANGKPRKWELQANINGKWVTESTTGLFIWNVFGSKSMAKYSNDALPPRERCHDA
ncbi:hypothetical protein AZSI13_32690 [Azospira sp. I13]|nr:hypothetical protein AZSI13_32690 [Azospira sp. I13]